MTRIRVLFDLLLALRDTLDNKFELESEEFQKKWDEVSAESLKTLKMSTLGETETYELKLLGRKVYCIASGEDETEVKLYGYSRYVGY